MSKQIWIKGMPLTNANGDIDSTSTGFQYTIDTLTQIRSKTIKQKFYEIAVADYMPVDVGEAAWMDTIKQNLSFQTGAGFYDGDVDLAVGGRVSTVDTLLSPISMPIKTWAKQTNWSIFEIAKAAAASNWDIVSDKLASLKKNWDLGIQETAFLGHPTLTAVTGLINAASVNINTSLITVSISSMSTTQFIALVGGLMSAYFSNSNQTTMPDTFIIPASDYLGLAVPVSSTFPNISKLEYLLNAFQRITGNPNFKILPLAYAQASLNGRGLTKDRYVLYRNNPDTLIMAIPVDFTMLEADTSNKMNWTQPAYGQYSGTLINRPREVLYLDLTST